MTEQQLPLIVPEIAEKARAELLSALDEADNPAAWMGFMESVTRLLPDVLSAGRPSSDAIARSVIGQLGFKSWQEMVEAPVDANGLGWNIHTWRAWRRAWATVQANPWLMGQPFTYSEINTWDKVYKPFPASLEALQQLLQNTAAATEQKRVSALAEAQKALAEALGKLKVLEDQLHLMRDANAGLTEETGRLRAEIVQLQVELGVLKAAPAPSPAPVKLSRFQHLLAFLFGSYRS